MEDETPKSATGKDVILEVVRAMRANVEPLLYSTIAPARFFVYLHPDDHARLEGIFPLVVEQARRALDAEVARWNEEAQGRRTPLRWVQRAPRTPPLESPKDGWEVRFEADADGDMSPGDIAVASELTLPPQAELAGSRTRRVIVRSGEAGSRSETVEAATGSAGTVYATLTYEDQRGRQTFAIAKNQLVIGRGGVGYWVDLKLQTVPDVSREHVRLRRDEATGQFYLKDLSTLGTTIDGKKVPTSVEVAEGTRRDKGVEVPLPRRARIGLAEAVFLEFEVRSTT